MAGTKKAPTYCDASGAPKSVTPCPVVANGMEAVHPNQSQLWVVGGASTVAVDDGPPVLAGRTVQQPKPADEEPTSPKVAVTMCSELHMGSRTSCFLNFRKRFMASCLGAWQTVKEWVGLIRQYPSTLLAPCLLFALLAGLGIWGVVAGAAAFKEQRRDDAYSRAVDAAAGFQIQLEQSFMPGVTFSLLVRHRPEWSYWLEHFNQTAGELLARVPRGALWNLQLQPFAQVMQIYPFRPEDRSQVDPPRDLLGDPARRGPVLTAIQTREPQVAGPMLLGQGFLGALVRYPIFVPDREPEDTFGFRYPQNASALTFAKLPASVRNCSVCYNATTKEKWWGLMTVLINYEAVAQGEDAYLSTLRKQRYHYALVRPINDTAEQVIAQVGPTCLRNSQAVTVNVKALNSVWLLRVAPEGGFTPVWLWPLVAAVIVLAAIFAALLLAVMLSLKRTGVLLQETMAANRSLAETTKRLEEEKERMDVLLVRQYDLLNCLDVDRFRKEGLDTDSFCASKKKMLARIEDARRSLNVAKSSVEDPIQVFEVLGAGAFGKVQRGLWRGTEVAVKTMILPANMTGQQKREKMAVMEAAISSSLVHPNIVTTYTYFIRPYHEPTHDGVQQMLTTPSTLAGGSSAGGLPQAAGDAGDADAGTGPDSDDGSTASESSVCSYEVRLVLEFCDKGSLKDALDQQAFMQGGSLNLPAMLETAADVAKAMVHMHAANVLHSDLKARNIMLKSSGMDGRGVIAKVADFGLSTRMEHQETHLSSCFQGTLTHMAPEVMLEGRISKAADVYSFGILMWELFCAGDPFAGVPQAHIGHAITKEARRPKFPPFAPRDYVSLASRCWDPDASLRPTFEEVLAELVRMREELGGDTPQLVIAPPRPLSRANSRNGKATSSRANIRADLAGCLVRHTSFSERPAPLARLPSGSSPRQREIAPASVGGGDGGGGGGDGGPGGPEAALGGATLVGVTAEGAEAGGPEAPPRGFAPGGAAYDPAAGMSLGVNPLALYSAGIVVGGSQADLSLVRPPHSGEAGGVGAVASVRTGPSLNVDVAVGGGGRFSSNGAGGFGRGVAGYDPLAASPSSPSGVQAPAALLRLHARNLTMPRQARKQGLLMPSRSNSFAGLPLPSLHEEELESR